MYKDSSSKFYRSDGTLKSTLTKKDDIDDYILKNNNVKSVRSNSLDRLTSAYNNILGNSTYPSASGKLQKYVVSNLFSKISRKTKQHN